VRVCSSPFTIVSLKRNHPSNTYPCAVRTSDIRAGDSTTHETLAQQNVYVLIWYQFAGRMIQHVPVPNAEAPELIPLLYSFCPYPDSHYETI